MEQHKVSEGDSPNAQKQPKHPPTYELGKDGHYGMLLSCAISHKLRAHMMKLSLMILSHLQVHVKQYEISQVESSSQTADLTCSSLRLAEEPIATSTQDRGRTYGLMPRISSFFHHLICVYSTFLANIITYSGQPRSPNSLPPSPVNLLE